MPHIFLHPQSMKCDSWASLLTHTFVSPYLGHVHVPTSSSYLLPLLGPRFFLAPMRESNFDSGLRKKKKIYPCHLRTLLILLVRFVMQSLENINLYFTCNLMLYICVISYPIKIKVMSSSYFMFILLLCRSIMEFCFYGFLGMFHIQFIHPRCFYWMVTFPFNQVLSFLPP